MRKTFSALLALSALAVAAPAMAEAGGVPNGGVGNGNSVTGSVYGGYTFTNNDSTTIATGVDGQSASGFNAKIAGSNGYAAFGSIGEAASSTTVTAFSVNTQSSHSGIAGGFASSNAGFDANAQTFGQSKGAATFTTNHTDFETGNLGFGVSGSFDFKDKK